MLGRSRLDPSVLFKKAVEHTAAAAPDGRAAVGRRFALGALTAAFAFSLTVPAARLFFPSRFPIQSAGIGMPSPESGLSDLPAAMGMAGSLNEEKTYLAPRPLGLNPYKVAKGDTVGDIAKRFGLTQDTILSVNGIRNSRLIQIGQVLSIPNQDGILYVVRKDDTLESLAEKYEIAPEGIRVANGLSKGEPRVGETLFLPEARLARVDLQEINGDLFKWPVRGYVSSRYGWRTSPFTGAKQFHSGLDIAAPHGTPLRAAMGGRVVATGYDVNSGNYVVIAHHSGYRTLYGHMDVIRVQVGETVQVGQRIGDVGSTGLSTGSHCHFTVFKNGATVNPINLVN